MIGQVLLGGVVQNRAVQATSAAMAVPVTATTLHAVGLSSALDTLGLSTGLVDGGLWFTLGVAAGFGALGGIVAELMSLHGRIELPHRVRRTNRGRRCRLGDPRHEVDLAVFSRMLLGAAAALSLLVIFTPGNAAALVVNALIAGSAATGVIRLVQGRMLAQGQIQPQTQSQPSAWTRSSTSADHPKSTAPKPVAA